MRNLFRMSSRIGDCDGTALGHSQQRKPLQALCVNDGLEVIDPGLKGISRWRPVRKTTAALIISDVGVIPRQLPKPCGPHRTFRVILDVTQPMRRPHQWRSMTEPCHRNPGTVPRFAEANLLMQANHGANRLHHIQSKRQLNSGARATYMEAFSPPYREV